MVAVVDIVMRVEIVVPNALADAERTLEYMRP